MTTMSQTPLSFLSEDDLIMAKHEVIGELARIKGNERIFFSHQEWTMIKALDFKLQLIKEALEDKSK